ncbi:MAG: NAD-dependent epimerase/dehydratase family protein [Planctomycetes bacterium]|nr:NAD-dependent epimerase/dehydratase family protein [Planctomycetota bacterium]
MHSQTRERIVITGATGFVGRRFVARLAADPARELVLLVRRAVDARELGLEPTRAELVRCELGDAKTYAAALAGARTLVHLAARTGKASPAEFERDNVATTRELVNAARAAGVARFVHVSTIAVNYPEKRHYAYARSKEAAEALVRASAIGGAFDWAIVRPTIVLGRGAPAGAAMQKLASGGRIKLFGDGRVKIQPIDVDDLATLLCDLLARPELARATFEFGGPEITTFREFLGRLHQRLGGGAPKYAELPLGLALAGTALVEPVLRPLMPLTAGQLYAFAYDSLAAPNELWNARRGALKGVDALVDDLVATGASA